MKGLFIPEITAEMFKNGSLEGIEALMAEGEIYDIEYSPWIPVSERLPERYKVVIVTDIETSDTYQSRYIGNGYWECDNGTLKNRIIAWMPLPEPYEKEEAENEDT